jgi:Ca2+-binding RTX toxin-like protein
MKKIVLLVIVAMVCSGLAASARPTSRTAPRLKASARSVTKAAPATGPTTFGNPTISGIQGYGFEPDLRIDSKDRVYTSSPNSLGSGTSWLWRSLDHGKTFKWVPASAPLQGKLPGCVGGGDTELAVDSGDHLYFNDLTLANFTTARSDDQGQTFTPPNCVSTETTPNDRQWYATDGDATQPGGDLYLTYNIVAGSPSQCGSEVGNNVLVMARSPIQNAGPDAGVHFGPSEMITPPPTCAEAIMGNNEVSPKSHKIFVVHDNAELNKIRMGVCNRVPFTQKPSGLECRDHLVADLGNGFKTGGNFPTMAIDKEGNLYAVWEQAPINDEGVVTGDTLLYYSTSVDGDGAVWSDPIKVPTPGLHNNVFAWIVAGDRGNVDIAWYGTEAEAKPTDACPTGGPDTADGLWHVYFTQSFNGLASQPVFRNPIDAVGHHIHKGTMFTLIGKQCGNRSLGDFFQLRAGLNGEANISYGDSTNRFQVFLPHNMFIRQNGGRGVYDDKNVPSEPYRFGGATDPPGDGTYDAATITTENQPNLDILSTDVSRPDADHYRFAMTVADLTSLDPDHAKGNPDTDLVWQTQWFLPSAQNLEGGKNFFVYMEKAEQNECPTFWDGENAVNLNGGGIAITYPGVNQIRGSYTPTAPGTIWIDVPIDHVKVPEGTVDGQLHEITASTQSLPQPPQDVPQFGGIGGSYFNLIDAAPSYDWEPGSPSGAPNINPDACGVQTGPGPTPSASGSTSPSPSPSPSTSPSPGRCTQTGTSGSDRLTGTQGRDVLCGLGGDDVLKGLGGHDILLGGGGRDLLRGGRGADREKGRRGADRLLGGRGHDRLKGNRGKDRLRGGLGDDVLFGGPAPDRCTGGPGKNRQRDCED